MQTILLWSFLINGLYMFRTFTCPSSGVLIYRLFHCRIKLVHLPYLYIWCTVTLISKTNLVNVKDNGTLYPTIFCTKYRSWFVFCALNMARNMALNMARNMALNMARNMALNMARNMVLNIFLTWQYKVAPMRMPRSGSFILGIKWKSQGLKPLWLPLDSSYEGTTSWHSLQNCSRDSSGGRPLHSNYQHNRRC